MFSDKGLGAIFEKYAPQSVKKRLPYNASSWNNFLQALQQEDAFDVVGELARWQRGSSTPTETGDNLADYEYIGTFFGTGCRRRVIFSEIYELETNLTESGADDKHLRTRAALRGFVTIEDRLRRVSAEFPEITTFTHFGLTDEDRVNMRLGAWVKEIEPYPLKDN